MKPIVAVLLFAADARANVIAGVGASLAVRQHASMHELLATLDGGRVDLIVVDAAGRSMAPAIRTIHAGFPTIPILAYCSLSSQASVAVLDVAHAGATGLVFRGVDDAGYAMRAAIRDARQNAAARRVHEALAPRLPTVAQPFLRYAISRAGDDPTVDDAARSLAVDRKTLFNWLQRCGSIGPRELINWTRIAIGVGLLEDPRRTAEQVAMELGFASGTAFRNMLRRYTGANCSEIRAGGGLDRVLAMLVSRLEPGTRDALPLKARPPEPRTDDAYTRLREAPKRTG